MRAEQKLTLQKRIEEVRELYNKEAEPIQSGASAGSRKEGMEWKNKMTSLLSDKDFVIKTVTAKSSDNKKIDGNASERTSYYIMRFKQNPLMRGKTLVIAFNCAFEKYENGIVEDLREQVGLLNGLSPHNQILLLTKERHYVEYLRHIYDEPEEDEVELDGLEP